MAEINLGRVKGDKGDTGADGLTTSVKLGDVSYSHVNGTISLPAYPSQTSELVNDAGFLTSYVHNHDDRYYTETETDTKIASTKTEAITDTQTWAKGAFRNDNLLINGYLKNAVNQLGQTTYAEITETALIPSVDMWYVNGATANVTSNGMVVTKQSGLADGGIYHHSELTHLLGETVTLSAVIDGVLRFVTGVLSTDLIILNFGGGVIYTQKPSAVSFVLSAVTITDNATHTIKYLKLEKGGVATDCPIPKIGEELFLSQRYYQIRSTNNVSSVDMRPLMRLASPTITTVAGGYAYDARL